MINVLKLKITQLIIIFILLKMRKYDSEEDDEEYLDNQPVNTNY